MLQVTITGAREVEARFKILSPLLRANFRRAIRQASEEMATYGKTQAWSASGLTARTGNLRRSFAAMPITETSQGLIGGIVVGQNLPYAWIQDQGGVVRATNAQFLTIPVGEALTPSGVPRFDARGASAAGWRTFVLGNKIYGQKGGKLTVLFILRQTVTLKPTYFVTRIVAAMQPMVQRRLNQAVQLAIQNSGTP